MRNIAMRRRKPQKGSADDDPFEDRQIKRQFADAEDRFRRLLSPIESYIMGLQSTLVWEIPSFSACVMIAVNILFWLATRTRFYHLLGMTGLMVVFVDIWVHKIWPEIRVPPPPNEDQEEWTPVHPKLLGVPELSRHLAGFWITTSNTCRWLYVLRKRSRAKFFVVMMAFLLSVGIIGLYISGITLLYFTVMSIFIVPPILYYNIYEKFYAKIEPTIHNLEKGFNIKRTRSRKTKKKGGKNGASGVSDSDEDLQEFVPENEAATPTLTKATQESEEESSGHTPDSLGDNETSISFTKGLKAIPDFDDSRLDDSLADDNDPTVPMDDIPDIDDTLEDPDSVLPVDEMPAVSEVTPSDSMQFISGHFKESSESDVETDLAEGLAFPDIQDELDSMAAEESSSNAAMATEMVSKTMSSLMATTMSGLSKIGETASRLGETVRSAAKSATGTADPGQTAGAVITFTKTDDGDDVTTIEGATSGAPKKSIMESTDSDILAEFEFLDQEDLDVIDDDDSLEINSKPPSGKEVAQDPDTTVSE